MSLHTAMSKQVLNCVIAFHLYNVGNYRETSCPFKTIDFSKGFWEVVAKSYLKIPINELIEPVSTNKMKEKFLKVP